MDNYEKYQRIFMEIFGVQASDLTSDFTFEKSDLWDSMSHMALISKLEEQFDIMLDTQDILEYGSFDNGIEILKKYGVKF